jgi:MinD superfamily P-loop ATPase
VIVVNRAEYYDDKLKTYCKDEALEIIAEIPDDRHIAECYSVGDLAVDQIPRYQDIFGQLAQVLLQIAQKNKYTKVKKVDRQVDQPDGQASVTSTITTKNMNNSVRSANEVVVVSGKGGTGKTSLVASFCAIEKTMAIADCDVDAADLHLILKPEIITNGYFSGGQKVEIDLSVCSGCGECKIQCRFDAIQEAIIDEKLLYIIDEMACEGCGLCELVCKEDAVRIKPAINGEWFVSETRYGPMSNAALGLAEENSGKLVTLVRKNANELIQSYKLNRAVIDGSPGTGCPVIASITGAKYVLIVTEPTVSGVHDLKRILDVVKFFKVPSGVIVNKSDLNLDKTEEIRFITKEKGSDYIGTVPYDKQITEAQVHGLSTIEFSDSIASRAIRSIWERVKKCASSHSVETEVLH